MIKASGEDGYQNEAYKLGTAERRLSCQIPCNQVEIFAFPRTILQSCAAWNEGEAGWGISSHACGTDAEGGGRNWI